MDNNPCIKRLKYKKMKTKKILKFILFPLIKAYIGLGKVYENHLRKSNNLKGLVSYYYFGSMHKFMDWNTPKDLNAKINWLKFYGDRALWARLADKYRVREYVKERECENFLVDIYGKWDAVEEIDWDKLPDKFIIKLNTGSGGNIICNDKAQLDLPLIKAKLNNWLKTDYSDIYVEPHYSDIKPCIIAEELLDANKQDIKSSSLVDYKVWAFNGEPAYIWVCYNRTPDSVEVGTYDLNWNYRPEKSVFNKVFKEGKTLVPKPKCLTEMLETASKLSVGHPQVRVDFYVVNNKCYFGEMTFTSLGGYMNFYTKKMLREMGEKTDLSLVKNARKYE